MSRSLPFSSFQNTDGKNEREQFFSQKDRKSKSWPYPGGKAAIKFFRGFTGLNSTPGCLLPRFKQEMGFRSYNKIKKMGSCQGKEQVKMNRIKRTKRRVLKKDSSNCLNEAEMKKELDKIFDRYDSDKDGELSKNEVLKMLSYINQRQKKPKSEGQLDMMLLNLMDKADKSKDGKLYREEFYLFYKMM